MDFKRYVCPWYDISMKSVTAFAADEETQTIYIGGNKLTVPIEEASYWNYNEVDGTIKACAEQEANVLINTEGNMELLHRQYT